VVMLRFRWGRGRSTLGMRLRWLVGNPRPEASMVGLVGDHLRTGQRPYTIHMEEKYFHFKMPNSVLQVKNGNQM
jgi:hypothetical protein